MTKTELQRTPLNAAHVAAGAKMVPYAGWSMPVQYAGIVAEHLATRSGVGLFDVSHMGRFVFAGPGAVEVLRRVLSNDASRLAVGRAHYTVLPNDTGGAIDDAYCYRLGEQEYLLVVNAANRTKDFEHLRSFAEAFDNCTLTDRTDELAMLALQGPACGSVLGSVLSDGQLPPKRNTLSVCEFTRRRVYVARTGYTGEPTGFELIFPAGLAEGLWGALVAAGASPVGLGARDSLRLEASLPLYGHELGEDLPILACGTCSIAVRLEGRGEFPGRDALAEQLSARQAIDAGLGSSGPIRRVIRSVQLRGPGVARDGAVCRHDGREVGRLTSGGAVPLWQVGPEGPQAVKGFRSVCLGLIDAGVPLGTAITVDVRGREVPAELVTDHLDSRTGPFARPR